MKTSFSRTFVPVALILIVALGSIGLFFQQLARQAMQERNEEQLNACAETVCQLATAYAQNGAGDFSEFAVNLSVAARSSGAQIQVCNAQGQLMLCSDAPMGCTHQGLQLSSDYLSRVLKSGKLSHTGVVHGLYQERRHVVSLVLQTPGGSVAGIVIASTPTTNAERALNTANRFFLMITLAVSVASICIMSLVVKRHSKPLRSMSKAAVAFGHGDLTARVEVDEHAPVEIRELTLAFNNMADSLQKSEYQRQEFVANVSHELKTPITTIAGFADGILDGTIPPQQQAHYLSLISEETKRLSRLVRSMLDISRLQEGESVPEEKKTRFDVAECVGQVLLTFEQKITGKKLDVQVDFPEHPVFTRANQDHIVQVVYNLLDNAVKFCPDEGLLRISIRTGAKKLYVGIQNSGQTIPAEELPLVFDRFHKIDKSRSQNRDGWGLGLYIVKTIIGAHGENISVKSQDGLTEFTFTLPLIN